MKSFIVSVLLKRCLFPGSDPASHEKSLDLTAADIFSELQTVNPAAMRGSNPMRFGQILIRAGLKRKHTEYGNVYEVVKREK